MKQILFVLSVLASSAYAETEATYPITHSSDTAKLQQRLTRIEQSLNNRSLLDLLDQVEKLQTEVGRLQGEIEMQNHVISNLKTQQRKRYTDIDSRLQEVQKNIALYNNADNTVNTSAAINLENIDNELANNDPADPPKQAQLDISNNKIKTENVPIEASNITVPTSADTGQQQNTLNRNSSIETNSLKAQTEYQNAFRLLRQSKYDQAIRAFKKYLNTYPETDYSDNAQYWLGETYYVTRDFYRAVEAYNHLIVNYPNSKKLPQGLLKLGYSYQELGQFPEAKAHLEELTKQYPGTTAARLANERLQKMHAGNQG